MPVRKKPSTSISHAKRKDLHLDPLTMPGPIEWVMCTDHERLPPGDPENYLLTCGHGADKVWTQILKSNIRDELLQTTIWHFAPMSVLAELPQHNKRWYCRHKTMAIMSMRICRGPHWLHELKTRKQPPLHTPVNHDNEHTTLSHLQWLKARRDPVVYWLLQKRNSIMTTFGSKSAHAGSTFSSHCCLFFFWQNVRISNLVLNCFPSVPQQKRNSIAKFDAPSPQPLRVLEIHKLALPFLLSSTNKWIWVSCHHSIPSLLTTAMLPW